MKMKYLWIIVWICLLTITGCTKEFLGKKPNAALLVPTSLADFQALLDNLAVMNVVPGIISIADGTLYTTSAGLKAYRTATERNSYTWATNVFEGAASSDWSVPYQQIFYADIVLDGLKSIKPNTVSQADYNRIKGSALFFRGIALYHLAQIFCKPITLQQLLRILASQCL